MRDNFHLSALNNLTVNEAFKDLTSLSEKSQVSNAEMAKILLEEGDFSKKFNVSAIGAYVNGQIAAAMSKLCDYQNQCTKADKTIGRDVFDFLNTTNRDLFKNLNNPESENSSTAKEK